MKKPWYYRLYVRSPLLKIGLGILAVLAAIVIVFFQLFIEPARMEAQTNNWAGRSVQTGAEIYANNCSSCHGIDGKGLPGVAPALHSKYFFTQRLADIDYTGSLKSYVEGTVAAGRPSKQVSQWAQKMPTWGQRYGGPLRDDQVAAVANFVLNWESDALKQGTPDNPDPWQFFEDAPSKAPAEGEAAAAATPEPTGPQPPEVLFVSMGCIGCHNINEPQTDQSRGVIAPNLGNLPEVAGSIVPGQDAQTYVHTSIVNPNAYTVEGYNPVMPANFTERMSEEEINALVEWLLNPDRTPPAQ